MTHSFFPKTLVALGGAFLIGAGLPVTADEPRPLLEGLFAPSTDSKKKTSSSSKKKPSSSSNKSNSSSSTASLFSSFSKTPEERAKEEAARKKADAVKAKADARKKYLAGLEKKKSDEAKARLATEKEKAKAREKYLSDVQKKKADAERARKLVDKKRLDDARKKALAAKKSKDERARQIAAASKSRDMARRQIQDDKLRQQRDRDADLIAQARGRQRRSGGGFFGFGKRGSSNSRGRTVQAAAHVQSPPDRYLYINERQISQLNSSNSRIEIDLSDQRARVYQGSTLMIETQISTGKAGFRTPTGNYSLQEKLRDKRSGRYGTWYSSSGAQLRGDDSFNPPPGASRFVGADMPYWMRVTGGIGMHIGYVPNGAASHGCIRVPSNVQPLIFSKVRVGTPIRIKG